MGPMTKDQHLWTHESKETLLPLSFSPQEIVTVTRPPTSTGVQHFPQDKGSCEQSSPEPFPSWSLFVYCPLPWYFQTGHFYIPQARLELAALLPQPAKCRDSKCVPLYPAPLFVLNDVKLLGGHYHLLINWHWRTFWWGLECFPGHFFPSFCFYVCIYNFILTWHLLGINLVHGGFGEWSAYVYVHKTAHLFASRSDSSFLFCVSSNGIFSMYQWMDNAPLSGVCSFIEHKHSSTHCTGNPLNKEAALMNWKARNWGHAV